jgi:hypothetical protein
MHDEQPQATTSGWALGYRHGRSRLHRFDSMSASLGSGAAATAGLTLDACFIMAPGIPACRTLPACVDSIRITIAVTAAASCEAFIKNAGLDGISR